MNGFKLDRTVGIGIIVTLAVQSAGALMWGGAAEARLKNLEKTHAMTPPVSERMARLEEQMTMARQSLERIEHRLDQENN